MMTTISRKPWSVAAVALMFVLGMLFSGAALAEKKADATIEISLVKAGLIVGGSGGSGVLKFKGKEYPLSIGGISLGATIGVSKAELIGNVYNLKQASDIEGTYTAGQASAALAGGEKQAVMNNSKGVQIDVKGKQIGVELALDLNGMSISLK